MTALRDLEQHLRAHGCGVLREGSRHTIWTDAAGERRASVPQHRELPRATARAICDQLGVPRIG